MRTPVYNSGISNVVHRASHRSFLLCIALHISLFLGIAIAARAADWNAPEQQLARKIVAVSGPGAVALTVENHSSLGKRDSDVINNGLRAALEAAGLRFVKSDQAAASVTITLSENSNAYVWVAEIRQGVGEASVVMVSAPRADGVTAIHDSVPLSLRKTPLWTQPERILDVAVLEENAAPTRMAVLDSEKVSLYRLQGGKWQSEQTLAVAQTRPWPRDLRGRVVPARDHLLDVYLPGTFCRSTSGPSLSLSCRESDDPWPLVVGSFNATVGSFPSFGNASASSPKIAMVDAFFAPSRNFFTGALTPGVGKFATVPKFFSAAFVPREKYTLWLFAAVDGQVHLVDGVSDQPAKLGWGSDVASLRTACGAGWQVLATTAGDQGEDSIRAYEFPDRDAVPVSAAVEFPGAVSALWTEAKGDSAIVVARNRETGSYEAFRLAIACNQ